ncbi:transposase [Oceanobacillus alkalisoli]|uniref:transposase n=1 Tax=Oceanobacillus alkalisoli TaxID=2925113 RepID=UPI001F11BDBA|nr:transposase [Oceanobacillus alkalisoli]MCF3944895.1 transposase [Oceanobacillus alkalisoli]
MITRMELDPAKQRFIYGFFETYLKLSEEEEEKLMKEIRDLPEAEKTLEFPISYEKKGKEIGRKEGRLEGVKQVAEEMLKEGASLEFISKVTKLTMEELEKLKRIYKYNL